MDEATTEISEELISCDKISNSFTGFDTGLNHIKSNGLGNNLRRTSTTNDSKSAMNHSNDVERGKIFDNESLGGRINQVNNIDNLHSNGTPLTKNPTSISQTNDRMSTTKISVTKDTSSSHINEVSSGYTTIRSITSESTSFSLPDADSNTIPVQQPSSQFKIQTSSLSMDTPENAISNTDSTATRNDVKHPSVISLPSPRDTGGTSEDVTEQGGIVVDNTSNKPVSSSLNRQQRTAPGVSKMTKSVECWGSGKPFASLCQSSMAKNITLTVSVAWCSVFRERLRSYYSERIAGYNLCRVYYFKKCMS